MKKTNSNFTAQGKIKGVEYEIYKSGIFPNTAYNQNVACARCYSERSAVMMLPARSTCPAGWYKEYEGGFCLMLFIVWPIY